MKSLLSKKSGRSATVEVCRREALVRRRTVEEGLHRGKHTPSLLEIESSAEQRLGLRGPPVLAIFRGCQWNARPAGGSDQLAARRQDGVANRLGLEAARRPVAEITVLGVGLADASGPRDARR